MLEGQVFKGQVFENQVFAAFINLFCAGKNGVVKNYKNGMKVTNGIDAVTIQSGLICIQGRFLEEKTSTTVPTGNNTAYCSLVIEIDLDKENTDTEFNQGKYRIITSANDYPILTKNDIVNTNSGVYQYELARFKTSLNGISDFKETKEYLDYESLYGLIQKAIDEIKDGSGFAQYKNMYKVGDLFLSMSATNPKEKYGGEWVLIAKGRYLIGVDPSSTDSKLKNAGVESGSSQDIAITFGNPQKQNVNADYGNPRYDAVTELSGTVSNSKIRDAMPKLTCYIWQKTE